MGNSTSKKDPNTDPRGARSPSDLRRNLLSKPRSASEADLKPKLQGMGTPGMANSNSEVMKPRTSNPCYPLGESNETDSSVNTSPPTSPTPPADPEKKLSGTSLLLAVQRSDPDQRVPLPVSLCVEFLDKFGLGLVGIYRIPGSFDRMKQYIALFDRGAPVAFPDSEDPHVVCGVLKAYLREIPETIFTESLKPEFKKCADIVDETKRINQIRSLLLQLPPCYYDTMKLLVGHISRVAKNADVNKMNAQNLAMVLCPGFPLVLITMVTNHSSLFPENEN